jgi:hypothetical protein
LHPDFMISERDPNFYPPVPLCSVWLSVRPVSAATRLPAVARRRGRTVLWRVDDVLRRGLWRRTCALRASEKGCRELACSVCWSSLNAHNLY